MTAANPPSIPPKLTNTAIEILKALTDGPKTPYQLAERLDVAKLTIYRNLRKLRETGHVVKRELPQRMGRPACEWSLLITAAPIE